MICLKKVRVGLPMHVITLDITQVFDASSLLPFVSEGFDVLASVKVLGFVIFSYTDRRAPVAGVEKGVRSPGGADSETACRIAWPSRFIYLWPEEGNFLAVRALGNVGLQSDQPFLETAKAILLFLAPPFFQPSRFSRMLYFVSNTFRAVDCSLVSLAHADR